MRVRDIKISIKAKEDLFNEVKEVWGKLEKGEQVKKHEGISFENIEAMRKILSEERLRILKTIKRDHPKSIYGLAKLLDRDIKNTFDDVHFLAKMGLIELTKESIIEKTYSSTIKPFVLSPWFDRLTTIVFFRMS